MPIVTLQVESPLLLLRAGQIVEEADALELGRLLDASFIEPEQSALMVFDLLDVRRFEAGARHALGAHRRRHREAIDRFELGVVVLMRSGLVRGAVSAVQWVSGAFKNHRVVTNRAAAQQSVDELCELQRIALGHAAREALTAFLGDTDRAVG
jgi:hypothetical protein